MLLKYPTKKLFISQSFNRDCKNDPIFNKFYLLFDYKHPGVDFPVPVGTKIYSAFPGIVVRKESHKGMGNVLGARYGNIVILYAHLKSFQVGLGDIVKTGEQIAISGDTGNTCIEPHLHFETRDITKPTLKEMVFNPPFGKSIRQLRETLIYRVNNDNTKKTLKFLSSRYFGDEKYWKKILKFNSSLSHNSEKIVPQGTKIVIPNYE